MGIREMEMDVRSFVSELRSDWDQAKQLCSHFGEALKDDVATDFIAAGFRKAGYALLTTLGAGIALAEGIAHGNPVVAAISLPLLGATALLGRAALHDSASAEDMFAARDGCSGGLCGISAKTHHL